MLPEGNSAILWPDIDEDLLKFLEEAFPPRCYEGVNLEGHLMYAGKVRLVQTLRDVFEEQRRMETPEIDLEDDGA